MSRHLSDYAIAYVAWASAVFCLVTHQPDAMRFFSLLAVLAVVVADLGKVRRDLAALRADKETQP